MDGTRLGTAILLFSFTQAVLKSRISVRPLLLLCLFRNSRHMGQLFHSPKPTAEVQVSQGRARVRHGVSS